MSVARSAGAGVSTPGTKTFSRPLRRGNPFPLPFLIAFLLATTAVRADHVLYVAADASGANNGSSWADAYADLQSALDHAEKSAGAITEIWVAQGTYIPSKRTDPDDPRSATFMLLDGLSLYGGFAGTESSSQGRDTNANRTTLSGDLDGDDKFDFANNDENSYHVVTGSGTGSSTTIDGFLIRGGHANGTAVDDKFGGGMYLDGGTPRIHDCAFAENKAGAVGAANCNIENDSNVAHLSSGGGGLYVRADAGQGPSSIVISRCEFEYNETGGPGAGAFVCGSGAILKECSFNRNTASSGGGLAVRGGTKIVLDTCSFSENTAFMGGAVAVSDGSPQVDIVGSWLGGNEASYHGGGVYAGSGVISVMSSRLGGNSAVYYGGGLYGRSLASLTLVDSLFSGNEGEIGGGVMIDHSPSLVATGCNFEQNRARESGGGIWDAANTMVLEDCIFRRNSASGWRGGGAYLTGQTRLRRCTFRENYAPHGGALYLYGTNSTVSESTFSGNSAAVGAGITVDTSEDTKVDRCRFWRNSASVGAGICTLHESGVAEVGNSLFVYNHAWTYGGGIASGTSELRLLGSTLSRNTAAAIGAGLAAGRRTTVSNSIFWDNVADPDGEQFRDEEAQVGGLEFVQMEYSTVQGWSETFGEDGMSDLDPLFVDPVDPDGYNGPLEPDFRLQPDSPCINAGDPGFVMEPGQTDLDGHARRLCRRVDMGAYEFGIGDFDCDRDADLADFNNWRWCRSGPAEPASVERDSPDPGNPIPCHRLDFDADSDVDLRDFAGFQRVFGG